MPDHQPPPVSRLTTAELAAHFTQHIVMYKLNITFSVLDPLTVTIVSTCLMVFYKTHEDHCQ